MDIYRALPAFEGSVGESMTAPGILKGRSARGQPTP